MCLTQHACWQSGSTTVCTLPVTLLTSRQVRVKQGVCLRTEKDSDCHTSDVHAHLAVPSLCAYIEDIARG